MQPNCVKTSAANVDLTEQMVIFFQSTDVIVVKIDPLWMVFKLTLQKPGVP